MSGSELLEYSASSPEVFYRNERTYRNPEVIIMITVLGLLCTLIAFATYENWNAGKPWTGSGILAAMFAAFTLLSLAKFVRNPREIIEIRADGVQAGSQWWNWGQIMRIKFARKSFSSGGFIRIYVVQSAEQLVANQIHRLVILQGNKVMMPAHYRQIAQQLREFLNAHHRHVVVEE